MNQYRLRRVQWGAMAALVLTAGASAWAGAPTACAKGSEVVLFGAGGRPQGGGPPGVAGGPGAQTTQGATGDLPPQGIYEGCLDPRTGELTISGIKASVNRASWVLVDPKKAMLYSTGSLGQNMRDGGTIFAFHVESSGALTPRGTAPSGGSDPTNLAWDPHSGTLFVANHGEGIIGVIKTAADGSITALSDNAQEEGSGPSPRQKNAEAHGVAVDPTGRFLLSADFGADKLYVYRYDSAEGKLTPSNPAFVTTPPGSGPRHITFTPDGKYVVMNTEMDGRVLVYRWNEAAGTLEQVQVVDPFPAGFSGQKSAAEIQFSRNGKFFYLTLRGSENKLVTYQWDEDTGSMLEIDRVSTGSAPWSFGIDPSGKWLLVTNSGSGTVNVFAVDPANGKLTQHGEPVKLPAAMTVGFLAKQQSSKSRKDGAL